VVICALEADDASWVHTTSPFAACSRTPRSQRRIGPCLPFGPVRNTMSQNLAPGAGGFFSKFQGPGIDLEYYLSMKHARKYVTELLVDTLVSTSDTLDL